MVDEKGIATATEYFALIHAAVAKTSVRDSGDSIALTDGLMKLRAICLNAKIGATRDAKVILIGNGGSSAIASHIAIDLSKNGGIRAMALNDAPGLTCLANDFGVDEIFAKQLEFYALQRDIVIIVSSSGRSPNILRAAEQAFRMGLTLVTMSGMNPMNTLRRKGILSFFTPAMDYGLVEIAHLSLLHSIVSVRA